MPHVLVDGSKHRVSWEEFYISLLPEDTPVWYRRQSGEEGVGLFKFSSWYDGISAHVELIGGRRVILFPEFGDKIRRLKRPEEYPFLGHGI